MPRPLRVLFLCTGNYYRSRFAEAVFNHHAQRRGLSWRAFSRGLATHLVSGDVSEHVVFGLAARGIHLRHTSASRVQLREADLHEASRIIALHEIEHRPLLEATFPDWVDRVTYWNVHDIEAADPSDALSEIERTVAALLDELCA